MEGRKDIYQSWVQYTTKNDEVHFRDFVKAFVSIWESQLDLDWNHIHELRPVRDCAPSLSRLPDELLPAITKFIYIAKENIDKNPLSSESLEETELLIRCLIIICRNVENVPLIASCDYVSHTVCIATRVIEKLINEEEKIKNNGMSFLSHFCHFLECMYDPYFTWRQFLKKPSKCLENSSSQPALLHVEIVPFIYDCFQTSIVEVFPHLSTELLHVLGAAISGAREIPSIHSSDTETTSSEDTCYRV